MRLRYRNSSEIWTYDKGVRLKWAENQERDLEDNYAKKLLLDQPEAFEEVKIADSKTKKGGTK